jgi:hypothetical protein
MRRPAAAAAALFVAACSAGSAAPDLAAADLTAVDACTLPVVDGGAPCATSNDCARGTACFGGACIAIAACIGECACTLGRTCQGGTCLPPPGALCGPCGDACTAAGGACRSGGCATPCDETRTFCPRGFRCDFPTAQSLRGHCVPALADGCQGCAADGDCPAGEVCNVNNRRCVPAPTGPDARLEMESVDFLYTDAGGQPQRSRNLTFTLGFYSYRDPSFDPYALGAGACGSERSTFDTNAPFPLGPMRDAGDPLTLALPSRSIPFARSVDPDPALGFDYAAADLQVADWTAGAASWSGPGGAAVGPFHVAAAVPADYTTTPDLLAATPVAGTAQAGVTVAFAPPAEAGVMTLLELSYNEGAGNTVTTLVRIACRAADGAGSVTLPATLLASVPRATALSLIATRAAVVDFAATGLAQGRVIFGVQKAGSVTVSP